MTKIKKGKLTILAMLFAAALSGCSKSPVDPLSIRLSAEMPAASKSSVNDGNTFTAAVAGWESSATAMYGAKRTWQTTALITASSAAADITLTDNQYYNQNGTIKSYIKAWYPTGVLADDGVITFDGAADGTVDVLLASEVSGSALDAAGKVLAFNHELTQLKFAILGDASFGATTFVKSITIKDAGVPTGIDLKTDAVNYTTSDIKVPEIDGMQAISTSKTIIGKPTMIRPITGSTFNIDIETTAATYSNVVITVTDIDLKKGKAYTITLSFDAAGITTQTSVTAWDDTGVGSGDVATN